MSAESRRFYLAALGRAEMRPVRGDPDVALHAFLSLNAGYFLGEWLPPHRHAALVRRLAGRLDGLAGLPVPADPAHAAQFAQHVRELAAEFGSTPWTAAMAAKTAVLVPDHLEDWDAALHEAALALTDGGDGHALLLAHARRRLWQLTHPSPLSPDDAPAPTEPMRRLARAALNGNHHAVQVTEALLAEIGAVPPAPAGLREGLRQAIAPACRG